MWLDKMFQSNASNHYLEFQKLKFINYLINSPFYVPVTKNITNYKIPITDEFQI